MRKTMAATAALATALMLALSGCSSSGGTGQENSGNSGYSAPSSSASTSVNDSGATLSTAQSELGNIVVDQRGFSVYQFDKDTKDSGKSSCTGDCLGLWPPVPAPESLPASMEGITGKLGSITGNDGKPQLTLNGWPLYYFASDAKAGDTKGQGVKDVWWVVDAAGTPIK